MFLFDLHSRRLPEDEPPGKDLIQGKCRLAAALALEPALAHFLRTANQTLSSTVSRWDYSLSFHFFKKKKRKKNFVCLCVFPLLQTFRRNLPSYTKHELEVHTDSVSQTDGSPKVHLIPDSTTNKNPAFPDELELQNLLEKFSGHSLESQHTMGIGDTDSLSSHTSG